MANLVKQLREIAKTVYAESNYKFKIVANKNPGDRQEVTIVVKDDQREGVVKLWLDYDEAFDKYILQMRYDRGSMHFTNSLRYITITECEKYPKELLETAIKELNAHY